ncbi:uncharacterized protein LOC119669762 [Teleopsis dalmanni]|uniref:uncharacterized protein LOC119669762 n=1 Tax=Teleopsis dalmanni TaxID=139649 RepID=UPI0018CCCD01|nr:uncharacterized protein LOC119669762 [Teleopsis dalmanni]
MDDTKNLGENMEPTETTTTTRIGCVCDAKKIKVMVSRSCQTDDIPVMDMLEQAIKKNPDLREVLITYALNESAKLRNINKHFVPIEDRVANDFNLALCSNDWKHFRHRSSSMIRKDYINRCVNRIGKKYDLECESNNSISNVISESIWPDINKEHRNEIQQRKITTKYYNAKDNSWHEEVEDPVLCCRNKYLACSNQIDISNNNSETSNNIEESTESKDELICSESMNNEASAYSKKKNGLGFTMHYSAKDGTWFKVPDSVSNSIEAIEKNSNGGSFENLENDEDCITLCYSAKDGKWYEPHDQHHYASVPVAELVKKSLNDLKKSKCSSALSSDDENSS